MPADTPLHPLTAPAVNLASEGVHLMTPSPALAAHRRDAGAAAPSPRALRLLDARTRADGAAGSVGAAVAAIGSVVPRVSVKTSWGAAGSGQEQQCGAVWRARV